MKSALLVAAVPVVTLGARAAPAGAEVAGGCSGRATFEAGTSARGSFTVDPASLGSTQVIEVPLADTVAWEGSLTGLAPPGSPTDAASLAQLVEGRLFDSPLLPREREVVALTREGASTSDVGRRLGISTRAVAALLGDARRKLAADEERVVAGAVGAESPGQVAPIDTQEAREYLALVTDPWVAKPRRRR